MEDDCVVTSFTCNIIVSSRSSNNCRTCFTITVQAIQKHSYTATALYDLFL